MGLDRTGRKGTKEENETKWMEEMDWMNKAEGWNWIGLEEMDRK
jgi:hypothetical protein